MSGGGKLAAKVDTSHSKHSSAGLETSVGPVPGTSCLVHSLCPSPLPSFSEAFAVLQEILVGGLFGWKMQPPWEFYLTRRLGLPVGRRYMSPQTFIFLQPSTPSRISTEAVPQ